MTHEEYLVALRQMIERWCDDRKFAALSQILPGYLSLNGLTDGWANLYDALKSVRVLGMNRLAPPTGIYWAILFDGRSGLFIADEKGPPLHLSMAGLDPAIQGNQ